MKLEKIRRLFYDFFKSKGHKIVDSAPIVIKNDSTLMFTNAGMNQFKDIFLGNKPIKYKKIANTQKCLRVSGKHNDLEEVGIDQYHHTMFEMLGNWSFGDYFKKEAISMAWELLTKVYKLDEKRLFITVFGGDKKDKLEKDFESFDIWNSIVEKRKIIFGSKKDNFWEMGENGPCGPCSEVHIDLRTEKEIKKVPTKSLVNKDHPEVIEIWNLVFIQYNRKSNGNLEPLPLKHVDTGMGLERLSMALKGMKSTYEIEIFKSIMGDISKISGKKYGTNNKIDIAFRVISDHIRAVTFTISDGEIPSNNKAGYVIRRILRRAIRYGFSTLNIKKPFLYKLVKNVVHEYKGIFKNLDDQQSFIEKVILEEEKSFLNTLEKGLLRIDEIKNKFKSSSNVLDGKIVFELYDTYGFPYDLTALIANENKFKIDKKGFEIELNKQKDRSRNVSKTYIDDWVSLKEIKKSSFIGYDDLSSQSFISKYRKVKQENKSYFQIVFDKTPFYGESGGQVGDTGFIKFDNNSIPIVDTIKENDLIIHVTKKIPGNLNQKFLISVDSEKRFLISNNHTATHLLHSALREILGDHVIQKGSLVNEKYLRFDFSHFSKIELKTLSQIESLVNKKIRENINLEYLENISLSKAKKMGAMSLFGEKYGEKVRVVIFDKKYSIELCGGTHAKSTASLGMFKIISESSVSSGIRRIEAITSVELEKKLNSNYIELNEIKKLLKTENLFDTINNLLLENKKLSKVQSKFLDNKNKIIKDSLLKNMKQKNKFNLLISQCKIDSMDSLKKISYEIKNQINNLILVLAADISNKPFIIVMIDDKVNKLINIDAREIILKLAKHINGSGGGQSFFSTAGGKNLSGLKNVIKDANQIFNKIIS